MIRTSQFVLLPTSNVFFAGPSNEATPSLSTSSQPVSHVDGPPSSFASSVLSVSSEQPSDLFDGSSNFDISPSPSQLVLHVDGPMSSVCSSSQSISSQQFSVSLEGGISNTFDPLASKEPTPQSLRQRTPDGGKVFKPGEGDSFSDDDYVSSGQSCPGPFSLFSCLTFSSFSRHDGTFWAGTPSSALEKTRPSQGACLEQKRKG